jgi:hypothetical protein
MPRLTASTLVLLSVLASGALAEPITVQYLGAIIESQPGIDQGTPILFSNFGVPPVTNVRFKFFVPDYQSLGYLNSLSFSVEVYDDNLDDDELNAAERGTTTFVLNQIAPPGPLTNLLINEFSPDGYTSDDPLLVQGSLCGCELDLAWAEIAIDGTFFIRANRRGGSTPTDFYVKSPAVVEMDGQLVPEPATASLMGLGVVAVAMLGRRWNRRRV